MKYKLALFIGRFQPFHNGHLYSLEKCFELAESVIVGIGSSQESGTENNPWSYGERERMIYLQGLTLKVAPVPDTPHDSDWVKNVELLISNFRFLKSEAVVVSNNEWVTRLMGEAGYPIHETGLYNRDELEGMKIRALMEKGDVRWERRVPKEVAHFISSYQNHR